jgi:tRNA A-37 threonylcarbamoyl transferase component Bud32/photosystem II stability/assembly factor-like uncharacterized protein
MTTAHRPLAPGTLLAGRYHIERLIKAGGFAAVYVAIDTRQRKRCAVKETFDQSPDGAEQFQLEADILAGVRHPGLPPVWDYFQHGGGLYLVMEFIEGDDLEALLEMRGRLPEDQVRDYMMQLCEAMTALHTHQPPIIHRDIKPANIKITPTGQAVLVDFGIAKLHRAGNNTQAAARAVTDGFSPLEQYGQGSTDARSDIYAAGATMYNLLTGVIPPDAPSRVANESLVPPTRLVPTLSPLSEQIALKALSVRPGDRFQSADEMHRALILSAQHAMAGVSEGDVLSAGLPEPAVETRPGQWWCPICQGHNQSGMGFCQFCGTPAPTIEIDLPTRIIVPGETARPRSRPHHLTEPGWEIITAAPAGSQWINLGGRPGQGLVACGEHGLMVVHNGEMWVQLPQVTSYALHAIAAAPGHVWAVGEYGTVVHFTGGRAMVMKPVSEETLIGIVLDSPTSGWITTASGALMEMRDNLIEPVPLRRGQQVRAIAVDDVGDGWAVGMQSLLVRLLNGGWKLRAAPMDWGDLFGVAHLMSGVAWAVGTNGLLVQLDDTGWQIAPDLGLPTLRAAAFNRRNEGWAVGDAGALAWFDGTVWMVPGMPCPLPASLRAVGWLSDDEAWAVGEHGAVLRWRR